MKSIEARKIRSQMALHCISNQTVAERAGVSRTFVSYVINGQRNSRRVKGVIEEMIRERAAAESSASI